MADERVSGGCELVNTVRSRPNCYETPGFSPTAAADEIAQLFARKSSVLVGSFIAASPRQPVNPKARDSSLAPTPQLDVELNPIERKRARMAVGAIVVASCLLGALAAWWPGIEVGESPQLGHTVTVSLPPANPLATTAVARLVAAAPAYRRADEYRRTPFPADIKNGWFFANLRNGISIAPIDADTVTAGAGAVFFPAYRKRDFPDGIDMLSSGAGGRLFATVRAAGFVAEIGAAKGGSDGSEGMLAEASLSYPVKISSRFSLTPTIGASWASRRHNDAYFGVTESEALASGLPQFSAGSGFKDVSASLGASYRLTDRITVSAAGGATSLMGKVGDSPRVVQKTQPSGVMALSYRF